MTEHKATWRLDGDRLLMRPPPVRLPTVVPSVVPSVVAATARFYGVTAALINGAPRYREVVRARHIAMYIAKKVTGLSYPSLGREFNRDHSTILHGVKQVEERLGREPKLVTEIETIKARINEVRG